MREWHRLFFVNERRLRNFIARGAVDADSPAIRLVGMPKVDCLVDDVPARPRPPGARTGSRETHGALRANLVPGVVAERYGRRALDALGRLPVNVIEAARLVARPASAYSGGVDWAAKLQPLLVRGQGALAPGRHFPYLVAADLMITDHSSAGFEFLLRDRPLVRIHRPQLIDLANVHPDYVALLTTVSPLGR